MKRTYPFEVLPLPYAYNALEPHIDEETLHFHHDKHYATYVANLNKALEPHPDLQHLTLEELLSNEHPLPDDSRTTILRNAGGVYNHELYFNCLGPAAPASDYMKDILSQYFTSSENWQKAMKDAALSVFGSGYALIGVDSSGELQLMTAANQDTPLHLHITPLLLIDVWEHAYYLHYQNRRADYLDQIFPLLNWDFIEQRYKSL